MASAKSAGGRPTGTRAQGPVGGQGAYYRRTGVSTIGATRRTRGVPTTIRPVRRGLAG